MDLPYDIKERIASHLTGQELAIMCRVDRDFRPFFMKKVGPVFMNEIKNISRIFKNLQNICTISPTSDDIMEDGGDHGIMSRVLGRCIEPYDTFDTDIEYYIWQTMDAVIDEQPTFEHVLHEFMMFKNGYYSYHTDDYNHDLKYGYMGM